MIGIAPQEWKTDLPEFCEKTRDFYAGKMDKGSYKGFSGRYGSYAQKGGAASMLRLRMTAGCVSKEKLAFIAKAIRAYQVNMYILRLVRACSFTIWMRNQSVN